jgi:hypothetical protein
MAWLNEDWLYRTPLTFANHGGAAEVEGQITIPTAMGKFWTNITDTFNDVRITAADGTTLLDWAFDGSKSKANRTATIQIDQTNHNLSNLYGNSAASASVGAFLYWGNYTTNLASGVNANIQITTTPKVVHVDLSDPGSSATNFRLKCYMASPDQVYPTHRIRKQAADDVRIYWDLSDCVMKLNRRNQQSVRNEEIAYVKAIIYDQDGNDTTSAMTVLNSITIADDYVVQMPIKAGDHEKRYIIIMTFGLVDEAGGMRVLDQRATLLVNNLALHTA